MWLAEVGRVLRHKPLRLLLLLLLRPLLSASVTLSSSLCALLPGWSREHLRHALTLPLTPLLDGLKP